MADPISIVVLEGDQTGQELLDQSLRLLEPSVLDLELDLRRFDLSLENRRASSNQVVSDAAAAMRESGLGLKAATITPEGSGDVGSPNRILREEVDGKVIVRTGRRWHSTTRLRLPNAVGEFVAECLHFVRGHALRQAAIGRDALGVFLDV